MADDKGGGGGGWEWGALEIVLAVLLVIGVLDRITGTKSSTISATPVAPVVQEDPSIRCGLSLEAPKPNEKSRAFITVRGTVGSCNWKATASTALYAQVVDAKGKSVTHYLAIPPLSFDQGSDTVAFDQVISFTATPAKGIGYLILVPALSPATDRSVSARIPLAF